MIVELKQPLWMKTPYGEALALFLTDYGPESDHLWTCVQQEDPHAGELWTWHNAEVRVLANRSMLRGRPSSDPDLAKAAVPAAPPPKTVQVA